MLDRAAAGLAAMLLFAAPAAAQTPQDTKDGCAGFRWPVERLRTALSAAADPVESGTARSADGGAFRLRLRPQAEARLVRPPERAPRHSESHAGLITVTAPKAGAYQIALTAAAWLDVIQNDTLLKPLGFSGAHGCAGLRKIVRYQVEAGPFTLQLSDAPEALVGIVVEPVEGTD